jgi:Phytanoyl-CoA dioxygenase (PhyH)
MLASRFKSGISWGAGVVRSSPDSDVGLASARLPDPRARQQGRLMDINTKPDGGSKARSGAEADTEQLLAQVGVVSPGAVADYQRQGWIVLAGLLPARLVAELLAFAKSEMGPDADNPTYAGRGARYAAWSNAARDSSWLRAVSQSAELATVASTLSGGRALRWYGDSFLAKKRADEGGTRTPWHQDLPQHAFDRGGALTMWIPLVDCPAAKGTMRFLTGSHRAGPLGRFGRRADGAGRTEDAVDTYPEVTTRYPISPPLDLRAGDVTVHDALTVHSAPENETDSIRWVYSITWFPAETLYTGAYSYHTNGLGLEIDQPFDDLHFPVVSA